jgi:uncharacterized protein (DUF433 family)
MFAIPPMEPVPLRKDADGIVYIGKSRVTLQTVVLRFLQGDSPEAIAENFDAIGLADIYAAIAFYLHHQAEVETYLEEMRGKAAEVRNQLETQYPEMLTLQRKLRRRLGRHSDDDNE